MANRTAFAQALQKAMVDSKRQAHLNGVVSLSLENWQQITQPPSSYLDGAPRGTNAAYYYRQMFRELAEEE